MKASQDDIDVLDGRAVVIGTDRAVTFRQVAKAVYSDMKTLPVEAREELSATYTYDPINGTTAAATHIAAVEIDPATCFVRILKYVVAEDCGRIINPMIVDGQVHGGVAQGIGAALFEEMIYDDDGQLLTASLVDYVIPSASEVPVMDVVHIESEFRCSRRIPRHGRGRHDRRAGSDRQRYRRRAVAARHRCFDSSDDSGADLQAHGRGQVQIKRKS